MQISRQQLVKRCTYSAILLIAFLWLLSFKFHAGVNLTPSLDGRFYVVVKGAPVGRGDLVAFRPPKNPYYSTLFVKIVKGVAGDILAWEGNTFLINGSQTGFAFDKTTKGDELEHTAPGSIPEDHYFAYGTHPRSFDSRYDFIGLIEKNRVMGRAYMVF